MATVVRSVDRSFIKMKAKKPNKKRRKRRSSRDIQSRNKKDNQNRSEIESFKNSKIINQEEEKLDTSNTLKNSPKIIQKQPKNEIEKGQDLSLSSSKPIDLKLHSPHPSTPVNKNLELTFKHPAPESSIIVPPLEAIHQMEVLSKEQIQRRQNISYSLEDTEEEPENQNNALDLLLDFPQQDINEDNTPKLKTPSSKIFNNLEDPFKTENNTPRKATPDFLNDHSKEESKSSFFSHDSSKKKHLEKKVPYKLKKPTKNQKEVKGGFLQNFKKAIMKEFNGKGDTPSYARPLNRKKTISKKEDNKKGKGNIFKIRDSPKSRVRRSSIRKMSKSLDLKQEKTSERAYLKPMFMLKGGTESKIRKDRLEGPAKPQPLFQASVDVKDKMYREANEAEFEALLPCSHGCGRTFKESSLKVHEKVCKKVFKAKRDMYDMKEKRRVKVNTVDIGQNSGLDLSEDVEVV